MRVRVTCAALLLVLIACSGASGLLGGGSGAGGDGGSTGDATEGGDDCSSDATGSSGDDGSLTAASGSGGGTDAPWDPATAPCPDISGGYDQLGWNGVGCGNANAANTVCIVLAQQICAFQLLSAQPTPDGSKLTVNGVIALQRDGTFSGAALQFGAVQRTGCTGKWDAASQTLAIDCGGMNSGCVVTMTRTGACQ